MPPIAILAGGLATRLGSLTAQSPKALLTVAGAPFVAHQLRLLRRLGIASVVLCIGHLGTQIREFVGDGTRFGLDVRYSEDGPSLAGTGGALRRARALLGPVFFVIYGDSYLDVPLEPIVARLHESGAAAVMVVLKNENRWDRSNAEFREGWIMRYDKAHPDVSMTYVDYGLLLLTAEALDAASMEEGRLDLAAILTNLSAAGRLAGYEVSTRFHEIGSAAGLAETEQHLQGKPA